MTYPKLPYVNGRAQALLHCGRLSDAIVRIRPELPGNVIVIHGVNDVGTSFGAVEQGLCQGLDTDQRLGNTGAATLFVQMAIAVMGSYRDGGVSAALNLRNPEAASIVLISPPSEEKRRTQQHPHGGDVLRHDVTPAIDPANYPSN